MKELKYLYFRWSQADYFLINELNPPEDLKSPGGLSWTMDYRICIPDYNRWNFLVRHSSEPVTDR